MSIVEQEPELTAGNVGTNVLRSTTESDQSATQIIQGTPLIFAPSTQTAEPAATGTPQILAPTTPTTPTLTDAFNQTLRVAAAEEAKKKATQDAIRKSEEKARKVAAETLGLLNKGNNVVNNSNEPTFIVNARRVIINSQSDPTMIFGAEGVSVSSPKQVSIDSDDRVILHGLEGVYLGIPNKGADIPAKPAVVAQEEVPDYNYEPLVLGLKLQNLLEDLIQVIKNVTLKCPGGDGYIREDAQWDLLEIQSRLPEILSTYAFVDGYSHPPKEKLSQPRPTDYDQESVAQTGTTTDTSGSLQTPVNTTTTSTNTTTLPNYTQNTTLTTNVTNGKLTISTQ